MATQREIEDALRNADAAGDMEDARKLADALVAMRKKPQDRQSYIEGVKSRAREVGRQRASTPGGKLESGVLEAARMASLGAGTPVEAAIESFKSKVPFGVALEAVKAEHEGRRQEAPLASLVGGLGGAIAPGAAAGRAASLAGGAIREADPGLVAGAQRVAQAIPGLARAAPAAAAAAEGAALSGAQAGIEGDNVGSEAALGGLASGALFPIAAMVMAGGGTVLRRFFPNRAAARLALERSDLAPD